MYVLYSWSFGPAHMSCLQACTMPGISSYSTTTESFPPAALEIIRTPSEWNLGPVELELRYIGQRTQVLFRIMTYLGIVLLYQYLRPIA